MPKNSRIEEIIRDSLKKSKVQQREYYLFSRILVYIKDQLPPSVNISSILREIEDLLPPHLMEEIDGIFIGSFDENEERSLEAHYESGAIYMTSNLPENGDYVEIESSSEKPVMVIVPKNIPSAHINLSKSTSKILTLADVAWKPNDNEMRNINFNNFEWSKFKK